MKIARFSSACVLFTIMSPQVFADASPWLSRPGSVSFSLTQIQQDADQFFVADTETDLPGDLSLSTSALSLKAGLSGRFALDAQIGYARSEFDANGDESSGIADSRIGLSWQLVDEFAHIYWPSVSTRLGAIIEGDYDVGTIEAVGDGGSGYELSVAVGKVLNSWFTVSAELGRRDRNNDIPAEDIFGLSGYYNPSAKFSTFVSYRIDNARDGLQIGGAGFSPDRFPELEEDRRYVQLGGQYRLDQGLSLGLSGARVIDGRNTSSTNVVALNLGYRLR